MAHKIGYHRKSTRLRGYDYASDGWYFITIRSDAKQLLFGSIDSGALFVPDMVIFMPNERSKIIIDQWLDLPNRFSCIVLDRFSLMPDHFHGLIRIVRTPPPNQIDRITIGDIVCAFKSITTKLCNKMDDKPGRMIWQRNYHERIIRDETELYTVRKYIDSNPVEWKENEHYLFSNELV